MSDDARDQAAIFEAAKLHPPEAVSFTIVGVKNGRHIRRPVTGDLDDARLDLAAFADMNRSVTWRIMRTTTTVTEEWVA